MAKEDTTVLKTLLSPEQVVGKIAAQTEMNKAESGSVQGDSDTATVPSRSNPQAIITDAPLSVSAETIARTAVDSHDPLADAPTLAKLTSESTLLEGDSVFAHLDKQISEQYADKTVFNKRFVLLDLLGAGGMGNVYLAIDLRRAQMEDSNPYIAIKVLNDSCKRMPGALQALQREAKKAQMLSHPNIVTVFDFDMDGETAFITMEYIEGDELKDLIRKSKIPQVKAMMIIDRVARGLAYAHQQGFVHADIKPANVFCAHDGAVKILDFGIAKAFTSSPKETSTLGDRLTEGALTPAYASLEMLIGDSPHPADDVYSLAVMAYELLSGRHPFLDERAHPISANDAHSMGLKPQPILGLSRRHMNALRKGLAFERGDRYQDAGEFIDAIKPRSFKKEIVLLCVAVITTVVIMFSGSQALDKVVPSVDSLKPELVEVAKTILEADEFMASEDIDYAHRLYSRAWSLSNDLTVNDADERNKARAILSDRMGKLSDILIDESESKNLNEFQLRELLLALEFLLQDEITDNDKKITKAITSIKKRIQ